MRILKIIYEDTTLPDKMLQVGWGVSRDDFEAVEPGLRGGYLLNGVKMLLLQADSHAQQHPPNPGDISIERFFQRPK